MAYYWNRKPKRKFPLYKEADPRKVPHVVVPSIESNREYYICYGAVDWDDTGTYRSCIYVVPHRWEKFGIHENVHYPPEDIEAVIKGTDDLKNKFFDIAVSNK